ncbi:hypothetical protein BRARA_H00626 [Brassica rapa]|uniref:DUF7746 domain-containing protein n=1 Tax=Brassica campestris TaxID=3711 RepID=A0A397Y9A7_BRACM|nr:hypothetical protein BRARA_H00626 [Brassica rapa]
MNSLRTIFSIKTEERDIQLTKPFETIHLFSENSLQRHREKTLNIFILTRFKVFEDYLLSLVESSLCTWPISFDCYPNFTVSLNAKNILKFLVLQVKMHNYELIEGSIQIALVFRIHYKAMTSAFSSKVKLSSKKGEALLVQTDLSRSNSVIPRSIQRKDINLPDKWVLEGAVQPKLPTPQESIEPNTLLKHIEQFCDRKVKLSFIRNNQDRIDEYLCGSSFNMCESSFNPETINLGRVSQLGHDFPREEKSMKFHPRFSTSDIPNSVLRNVNFQSQFPKPVYSTENDLSQNEFITKFEPTSPTFSAITDNIKQLDRIEKSIQNQNPIPMESPSEKKSKSPMFKHFQISNSSVKTYQDTNLEFIRALKSQLSKAEIGDSSMPHISDIPNTPTSKIQINTIANDSDISECSDQNSVPKINRLDWQNHLDLYDWNIDGISENNILSFLLKMTMAANAYRTQIGNEDKTVAEFLIAGFSGQLKGWWDNYLTNQQRAEILDSIKTDEDNVPILDNLGNPQQDVVATLVIAITLHFIGDPSVLRDKNAELLSNLKCKKLSDFQWYKNTFLTRVLLRQDSNQLFWKEKFLAGLPTLLGGKVRNKIRDSMGTQMIDYDDFTYGELISIVQQEGLRICQDLKLQKHLNGNSKERKKHSRNYKSFRSRENSWKKPQNKFSSKETPAKKPFYKDLTCFKCNKKGHTSNKIYNLLLNDSSSSYDSDSSVASEKALQDDELNISSSSSESNEKNIYVLTKDQELQLEILNSISDPSLKHKFLEKIISSLNEKDVKNIDNSPKSHGPSSYKSSYDLNKRKKDTSKTTIQDIRIEIKEVKNDLKILKEKKDKILNIFTRSYLPSKILMILVRKNKKMIA